MECAPDLGGCCASCRPNTYLCPNTTGPHLSLVSPGFWSFRPWRVAGRFSVIADGWRAISGHRSAGGKEWSAACPCRSGRDDLGGCRQSSVAPLDRAIHRLPSRRAESGPNQSIGNDRTFGITPSARPVVPPKSRFRLCAPTWDVTGWTIGCRCRATDRHGRARRRVRTVVRAPGSSWP